MAPARAANVVDFIDPAKAKEIGGDLEQTTTTLARRLASVQIADAASCQQAVLDRQTIGDMIKNVEGFFAPFKSMAHKLHKALCDRESEILAPIRMVDGKLRSAIGNYALEQAREREARERALADQRRKDDEARAAQEAAQLEAAGEHIMAAQVIEEAIAAPAPVVVLPDETKAIDGLSLRTEYRWRYLDNDPVRAFQLIPREYLVVDESKLTKLAKAMKGTARVPGVEFYAEKVPVR
jgi:hypothetical protein